MKDQCAGRPFKEYVGLCPKIYSILEAGGKNIKKVKEVKKNVVKKHIRHEQYNRASLESRPSVMIWMSCNQSTTKSMGST